MIIPTTREDDPGEDAATTPIAASIRAVFSAAAAWNLFAWAAVFSAVAAWVATKAAAAFTAASAAVLLPSGSSLSFAVFLDMLPKKKQC